jgi:hypothetical protein
MISRQMAKDQAAEADFLCRSSHGAMYSSPERLDAAATAASRLVPGSLVKLTVAAAATQGKKFR